MQKRRRKSIGGGGRTPFVLGKAWPPWEKRIQKGKGLCTKAGGNVVLFAAKKAFAWDVPNLANKKIPPQHAEGKDSLIDFFHYLLRTVVAGDVWNIAEP